MIYIYIIERNKHINMDYSFFPDKGIYNRREEEVLVLYINKKIERNN
jgi:hypothetical protein